MNAKYFGVSDAVAAEMQRAMDKAAAEFWKYPEYEWQNAFAECWFRDHGYPEAAQIAAES